MELSTSRSDQLVEGSSKNIVFFLTDTVYSFGEFPMFGKIFPQRSSSGFWSRSTVIVSKNH